MSCEKCVECGELVFSPDHKCALVFYATHEDECDPEKIYARDFEEAAEKFAQIYDERDSAGFLSEGYATTVTIAHAGVEKQFEVSAEHTTQYWAAEIAGGEE